MGNAVLAVKLEAAVIPPKADIRDLETAQRKMIVGTIQMAASYATGGDTIDLSAYFGAVPDQVIINPFSGNTYRYVAGASAAVGKVIGHTTSATEVANTTDLSTHILPFVAWGKP